MKYTTSPKTVIGIDLGDKKHAICVLDQEGTIIEEFSIYNRCEDLEALARGYPGTLIAMEVGTHSPWISRLLIKAGMEVVVANARKLRAIYSNPRKCDRYDARMLAKLARADRELLHPIEHRCEEAQRDLLSIKLRDSLVRQRTNMIGSIRGLLKSLGVRLSSCSTACFAKRARALLDKEHADLLCSIEPGLTTLESLSREIRELDKRITKAALQHYPEAERLQQIGGVGPITALSFILCIESPHRVGKTRDVGAYVGLVPRRDQSGSSDKQLGISKAGNPYVRRLLVQSAQYILGRFGPDSDLRRRGLALAAKGGKGAKRKAVIATARKLAVVMLTMWKNQTDYHPLQDGKAAAEAA